MTEDERATFVKDELATIGTFYDAISATFTQLVTDGKDVFIPDPVQVGDDIGVLKMPVDTKKTPDTAAKTFTPEERLTQALKRIEKIKEQGEGTSTSPEDVDFGDELSHYYRFSEIVQGYRYIPKTEEVLFGDKVTVWKYEGAPIKFPDVIAFPKLSTKGGYAKNELPKEEPYKTYVPQQLHAFNRHFTGMLTALDSVWDPALARSDRISYFSKAILAMVELKINARLVMTYHLDVKKPKKFGPEFVNLNVRQENWNED